MIAVTVSPRLTLSPAPGSVEITWPGGIFSEYAAEATANVSPAFSTWFFAASWLNEITSGVGLKRPTPNHQPPSAAPAASSRIRRKAIQPPFLRLGCFGGPPELEPVTTPGPSAPRRVPTGRGSLPGDSRVSWAD